MRSAPVPSRTPKLLVVAVCLAGLGWVAREMAGAGAIKPETTELRTATITTGDLERTIRVSGVVQAERFAALMAPRLRGSRGASGSYGGGGGKSLVGSAGSGSSSTGSSAGASSSASSRSSSAAASSASTNTAVNSAATSATAPSSLGAIRGTQNRFGDRLTAQANASKSVAAGGNSSTGSTALGSNGLGSTGGNLFSPGGVGGGQGGGGGGGGGGSDFALVLTKVAEPGSHVKKGQVVAEFDRQYQLNRLDDYKATVTQLDANLKKMNADLAVAKKAHDQLVESAKADWDKALLDLKTAEVRSAIEAEDLKLAAQETQARYKQLVEEAKLLDASQHANLLASEIERNQAKLELDRATLNLDRMIVHAPMDGIVVMQSIWRGGDFGQAQQGDQIWPGQTFMQIVDPSSMVLAGSVNQVDAESVRLGLKAKARLDAYAGAEFTARVIGIGAMTRPSFWRPNYTREIPIRLKLEQADPRVIPDLSASADILLAEEKRATIVPLSAIFQDGGEKLFVFLQTSSGWQRREITVGLRNHVAVSVRSGISPNDVVAIERPANGKAPS